MFNFELYLKRAGGKMPCMFSMFSGWTDLQFSFSLTIYFFTLTGILPSNLSVHGFLTSATLQPEKNS